jgi:hypothetical protein
MEPDLNNASQAEVPPEVRSEMPRRHMAGCVVGSLGGGCLVPLILFIFAAISGDVGGPLFWPILMLFTGSVGAALGVLFAPKGKRHM